MSLLILAGMVGNNRSVYKTAQYERLTQDPDDNEEEDDSQESPSQVNL